jgi:CYTH domain-containing protein
VRLEEGIGSLILVRHGSGERVEEVTDLPQGHAEALLDLAKGGVAYRRIPLSLGPRGVQVCRFSAPELLDLALVEFERDEHARGFRPLGWFGREVTTDPSYQNRSLALMGFPQEPEVELTDMSLNSLMDTLEQCAEVAAPTAAARLAQRTRCFLANLFEPIWSKGTQPGQWQRLQRLGDLVAQGSRHA